MKSILEKNQFFTEQENLKENLQVLQEMSTLRKGRSKLPANLYLDDTGSWITSKYWKRIKFQPNTQEKANPKIMIPMSIEDNPKILVENVKINLNEKEINQLEKFVSNNQNLILQLEEQKIDIVEFIEKMVLE
jgi:chaperonin GroEL (HSP60 family)